jgi:putative hydrolase of the HAD superfamily
VEGSLTVPEHALSAVVFDLGGVLTIDPFTGFRVLEQQWGLPVGWLSGCFRGDADFSAVERGELSVVDFLRQLRERCRSEHGAEVDLRQLSATLEANRCLRPEVPELLATLRAGGVRTALLTNNARESAAWREKHLGHRLDLMVDSSEVGARKPDPAIYKHVLSQLGLPAASVAYIDDFAENLAPARALGMATLLFTGWEPLLEQLRGWGALGPLAT